MSEAGSTRSESEPPVLSELAPTPARRSLEATYVQEAGGGARGGVPVHPLSALLLLGVDNLWNLADWAVIDWIITIPLSFMTVFFPVLLIQRLVKQHTWGRAVGLALLLAVIAAVPTSLFGSPVGLALLAWFGIDRLIGRAGRQ